MSQIVAGFLLTHSLTHCTIGAHGFNGQTGRKQDGEGERMYLESTEKGLPDGERPLCNQQVGGSSPSTSSSPFLGAQVNTGVFPSGQRGQTVNLLAMPTVVRIHPPPPEKQVKTPTMPGKLGVTRPERVSQFTLGHPLNFPTFSPKSQTGWTRTLHQHLNIALQGRIARQIWRRSGLFLCPKSRRSENGNQRRSP